MTSVFWDSVLSVGEKKKKARAVTISNVLLFSALRKTNPVSVYTDKITFRA